MHRALDAAERLAGRGITTEVIDLRSVRPLDTDTVLASVRKTGALLAVDEDYRAFGLTGELAAVALDDGLRFRYGRVATEGVIPYDRRREDAALPSTARIVGAAERLLA